MHPQPSNVPIIGQPFSLTSISIPVNATGICHCGGPDTTIVVILSTPAACPSCGKIFTIAYNPANQQVAVGMSLPEQKEPS